jgi:glycerol-3-phosphate dehydrogenase
MVAARVFRHRPQALRCSRRRASPWPFAIPFPTRTAGPHAGNCCHRLARRDARLAVALAQTASQQGATVLNYFPVVQFLKTTGHINGVVAQDLETGREYELPAKVVVNATGVFTDAIRSLDDSAAPNAVAASQGSHIVLDRAFLPGDTAIIVPKTDDGRVLFAIPWHGRVLVGTTDLPVSHPSDDPKPSPAEIDYLLDHAGRYLSRKPVRADVRSTFAGLRPLVRHGKTSHTALVPRDHSILISPSNLVTIAGGKWTTYRKMAEDTIDRAAELAGLPARPCTTAQIAIHNSSSHPHTSEEQTVRAAREEMARTVEDVLARRTRALFLDARSSIELAATVAKVLARELGRDTIWERDQLEKYRAVAAHHLVG